MSEAEALYRVVIASLGPLKTPAAIHSNHGAALLALDKVEAAEAAWEQALVADPKHAESHLNLAISLQSDSLLSPTRLALSQAHAEACLELRPGYAKAHHSLANTLQALGNLQGAQQHWELAELASSATGGSGGSKAQTPTASRAPFLSRPPAFAPKTVGEEASLNGLRITALSLPESLPESEGAGTDNCKGENASSVPLVLQVDGLLTAEECAHIRALASRKLQPSYAVGGTQEEEEEDEDEDGGGGGGVVRSGGKKVSSARTSNQAWLPMASDSVLTKLRVKVAELLGVSIQDLLPRTEDLQVVRYRSGERFGLHHDSAASFQRRALTILIYLNNMEGNPENPVASRGSEPAAATRGDCSDATVATCPPTLSTAGGETWFPFVPRFAPSPSSAPSAVARGAEAMDEVDPGCLAEALQDGSVNPRRCHLAGAGVSATAGSGFSTQQAQPRARLEGALAYARALGEPPPKSRRPLSGGDDENDVWGLRVTPHEGRAVLFYNLDSCGDVDHTAIHAALPVRYGEKWVANLWIADR